MDERIDEEEFIEFLHFLESTQCKTKQRWVITELGVTGESRVLCRGRKSGYRFVASESSGDMMPLNYRFKFFAWLRSLTVRRKIKFGSYIVICRCTMSCIKIGGSDGRKTND